MVVESVRVHMLSSQHVVILREADAERYLPIWIGSWEAQSIAMKLQGVEAERPLTHDLLASMLERARRQRPPHPRLRPRRRDLSCPDRARCRAAATTRSTRDPATPSRWPSGSARPSSPPRPCSTAPASSPKPTRRRSSASSASSSTRSTPSRARGAAPAATHLAAARRRTPLPMTARSTTGCGGDRPPDHEGDADEGRA